MQQEELKGNIVAVFQGISDGGSDVLLNQGGLHGQIYAVLETIYLYLFGKQDQLHCVYAHPRSVVVERTQLLQFVLIAMQY